jgi:hypothetical protein
VVLVVFLILIPRLSRPPAPSVAEPAPSAPSAAAVRAQVQAGERMLAEGRFSLARRTLTLALTELDNHPGLVDAEERRALVQLQRQSDVLARLLDLSLEEIVQKANRIRDAAEWQARFKDDYRGRAVIFDDAVERSGDHLVLKNYVVGQPGQVRLAREDLAVPPPSPAAPCRWRRTSWTC